MKPLNKFTQHDLGTVFYNTQTKKFYRLRRRTDPKTLEPKMYLCCKDDSTYLDEIDNYFVRVPDKTKYPAFCKKYGITTTYGNW